MSLKSTLEEIVSKHLPDDTYYLVDVQLVEKGPKSQLTILIDADQGVSIEACAKVSRQIAEEIEAKELLSDAYILEVSSPGLDFPLSSKRQYTKNVGRTLKVTLNDGKELEGQLLEVGNAEVKICCKIKEKGKKAEEQEITIPLEQIKKSIVLVSFK
ncbi:ribosome maturation factor RimP [Aquiflexum sp. TKW24L]|uniref:ribosome maturation factor RimP n=1 Tax=Aquiflexum sp. TKW24L TaxID=2942212 RepID=UPI0020BD84ED|nr:ribosome maturation factor RimP [Aquiflexum sp. TKW24L]MCL6258639.1 ribosome maturation factor RimP [Aquiflexum sp. TKW24L]